MYHSDEPTAMLDPREGRGRMEIIEKLHNEEFVFLNNPFHGRSCKSRTGNNYGRRALYLMAQSGIC